MAAPEMKKLPDSSVSWPKLSENGIFKRSGSVLRQTPQVKYHVIQRSRDAFSVRVMCRLLKVSHRGYYDWRDRKPSAKAQDDTRLSRRISQIHRGSDGVFGSPRVWEALRYEGERCGPNRVARLMKINGLLAYRQQNNAASANQYLDQIMFSII